MDIEVEHDENGNEIHSEVGPYMRGKNYYITYPSDSSFKLFSVKPVICDKFMFKNSSDFKKYLDEPLIIGEHIEWKIEFMSNFSSSKKFFKKYLDPYFRTYEEAFKYIEEYILENKLNLDKEIIVDEIGKD